MSCRIPGITTKDCENMPEHSKKQKGETSEKVGASHDLNKKPRFRWTVELHELFVKAVNELGGPYGPSYVFLIINIYTQTDS